MLGAPALLVSSYSDVDGTGGVCPLPDPTVRATNQDCTAGTHLDVDPLFVNPGLNDYHIQDVSLCVDAGDPAGGCGVFNIDLEDRVCIDVDMGADETQEFCP